MKQKLMQQKILFILIATSLTVGSTCFAQSFSNQGDGKWEKGINTHRLSQFPKLHPDGRIWFRYEASQTAQSVKHDNIKYNIES